ncbi:hypothetical protein Mapa_000245 [Marchantia paleacea]|nr:hypothetical protein Mapa_000245 [Marchantia paleacea]
MSQPQGLRCHHITPRGDEATVLRSPTSTCGQDSCVASIEHTVTDAVRCGTSRGKLLAS